MDNLDKKIIEFLKENGRISASEIGRHIKLSVPAVSERIKKLEDHGIIEKYTVILNEEKMGYNMKAFIFITINNLVSGKNISEDIMKLENVLECHHLSGEYDYLIKVLVKDTNDFEKFLMKELKNIDGIETLKSAVIFSSLL